MKIAACLVAASLLATNSRGGDATPADRACLASAYAAAFKCSGRVPVALIYQGAAQIETIRDVTDMKAVGGALIVTGTAGSRQILDATRIVKIVENSEVTGP